MAERVCFEDTVKLSGGKRSGKVAFIGPTKFSPGVWFGVSLKKGGKNDGSVQGVRYFTCKPNKGVFIPREKIQSVKTKAKGNRCTVGDEVEIAGRGRGEIKFIGPTQFAAGIWVGIELQKKVGKNNGRVKGVRYFDCKPRFGVFVKKEKLGKILTEEKTSAPAEVEVQPEPVVETVVEVVPEPAAPEPEPEPVPAAPEPEPEQEAAPDEAEVEQDPEPVEAEPVVEVEPVAAEPIVESEPATAVVEPVEPAEPIQEEIQDAIAEAEPEVEAEAAQAPVEVEPEVEPEQAPEVEAEPEQAPVAAEAEVAPSAPEDEPEAAPAAVAEPEAVEEATVAAHAEAEVETDAVATPNAEPSTDPEPVEAEAENEAEPADDENKAEYVASVADAQHAPGQWRPRGWLDDPPAVQPTESETEAVEPTGDSDGDSKVEDNGRICPGGVCPLPDVAPSVEVEQSSDNATEDASGQDVAPAPEAEVEPEAETEVAIEAEAVQMEQEDCESGAAGDEPMQKPAQAMSPRFDQAAFAMDLTATVGSPAASG